MVPFPWRAPNSMLLELGLKTCYTSMLSRDTIDRITNNSLYSTTQRF